MAQPHTKLAPQQAAVEPSVPLAMPARNTNQSTEQAPAKLESTFAVFNQLSNQLADSYQHLEQRVMDLTEELDTLSERRIDELQEKEQLAHRLEVLINVLPGGVIVLDKHGFIIESNPTAESLLEPGLQGRKWRKVIQTCIVPKDDDGHEVSNRQGKRISIVTRSLGAEGQIILLTDQTETRNLQAQLSRNERLSALGKMVSTLAHQVRTPLSSAMLYANHLCRDDISLPQRDEFSHKLVNRLHYMERQVRDMLLCVKGDVPITDRVSVNQLQKTLAESIEMPIKAYRANCQWESLVDDDNCAIQCNLDAMSGALLNLVNNSLQACKEPAEITIRFERKHQQLLISILDNGSGIEQAVEPQLKTMFFTTKEQGTGIGLSVVRIVTQSHGGDFSLSNRAEGGSCACITLPLCC
jgi:two-component system sensor histidine kinase FlrB